MSRYLTIEELFAVGATFPPSAEIPVNSFTGTFNAGPNVAPDIPNLANTHFHGDFSFWAKTGSLIKDNWMLIVVGGFLVGAGATLYLREQSEKQKNLEKK